MFKKKKKKNYNIIPSSNYTSTGICEYTENTIIFDDGKVLKVTEYNPYEKVTIDGAHLLNIYAQLIYNSIIEEEHND